LLIGMGAGGGVAAAGPWRAVRLRPGLVGQRIGRFERRFRHDLIEFSRREMQAHPQGRLVRATRSNHFIPLQEPELVAEEIQLIVRSIRGSAAANRREPPPP
jgi:hypothetical protein